MMSKSQALGTAPVRKLFWKMALPAVVAQIVNLLYNIVDRAYLGHMAQGSVEALTGAGLFMPILMLMNAFAMMIGAGGAPIASMNLGKNNKKQAEKILGNAFSSLIILAVILTVVLYAAAPALLRFFGASDATMPAALAYARIYILGTVFVLLNMGLNMFINAQGFPKIGMLTTIIGCLINVVMDPVFIFALNMGAGGAALSTVISEAVSAIWVLHFLSGKKAVVRLQRKNMKIESAVMKPVLALGVSSFVMLTTESVLSMTFNKSLSFYGGDIAVGAMSIITGVNTLIMNPLTGFTQGANPITSFNFGAGNKDRVKKTFRVLFSTSLVYAVVCWLVIMLFPHGIASVFTPDASVQNYTAGAMRIYFAMIFALGAQVACQQSFVALGQAKISLLMAFLRRIFLMVPLIIILPHVFAGNPVMGVLLAEPIADITAAVITTALFLRRFDRMLEQPGKKNMQQPRAAHAV